KKPIHADHRRLRRTDRGQRQARDRHRLVAGRARGGNYVLVRVADEAGHVGLGEASVTAVWSGESQAGCIPLIRETLPPLLVGADPFDSEGISRKLEKAAFGTSFARAAIEMALLDLQGQILGVPAYKLLGGRDRPPVAADPGVRLQFVLGSDRGVRLKFVI